MQRSIRNRLLMVLLSVMFAFCMFPAMAFAAGTTTVRVNNVALSDGVPVECGDGTITFDASENTLTLHNATVSETADLPVLNIETVGDTGTITIKVEGNNTITSTDDNLFPIHFANTNVIIQGTGGDTLTLEANSDCLVSTFACNLTIDGCNVNATSHKFGGISTGNGELFVMNGAKVAINSCNQAIYNGSGIKITDSSVFATTSNANQNTVSCWGALDISNSTVEVHGTSSEAYPALYAAGDISISSSDVTATSAGMRGLFTDANMTVTGSTVAATGTADEGMVVVDTLTLTDSSLTASGDSDSYAIATNNLNVVRSEVTAQGGLWLGDWYNTGNLASFSITPAEGELSDLKVDGANWDGSQAEHFTGESTSPYSTKVSLTADEITRLRSYYYVYIGEHVHAGGTATCDELAVCEDCGNTYGAIDPSNHAHAEKVDARAATCTEAGNTEYWMCEACGKVFGDAACTEEISLEDTVVPATGHSYEDGVCTVCGAVDDSNKPEADAEDPGEEALAATGDSSLLAAGALSVAGAASLAAGGIALGRRRS